MNNILSAKGLKLYEIKKNIVSFKISLKTAKCNVTSFIVFFFLSFVFDIKMSFLFARKYCILENIYVFNKITYNNFSPRVGSKHMKHV